MSSPERLPRLALAPLWYGCGLLLLLVVAFLSLAPITIDGSLTNDKTRHFLTYACMSGWFSLLVTTRRQLLLVWLGVCAFGIAIEGLQGMTGYRLAEGADIVANGLGAAVGLAGFFTGLPRLLRVLDARLAPLVGR